MPTTITRVRERVERGARLLDDAFGDWHWNVDAERLDLNSWERCVLGQLAAANRVEADELTAAGEVLWLKLRRRADDDSGETGLEAHGFIGAPVTSRREWRRAIDERRAYDVAHERQPA